MKRSNSYYSEENIHDMIVILIEMEEEIEIKELKIEIMYHNKILRLNNLNQVKHYTIDLGTPF